MEISRDSMASDHLDLVRGLSAVAVLVYHVRTCFFFDYVDIIPTIPAKLFYVMTAFGHDAVMVFFVLSGYFISASVRRDCALGRWSWTRYFTNRCVRLCVVLVPGLLLCAFWDQLGLHFFGDRVIYTGAERPWLHDFFNVAERAGPGTFLRNLLFLQQTSSSILPFGSNAPLWSLSFEFWYYMLFPLAWLALIAGRTFPRRILYAGIAVGIALYVVSDTMLEFFPIWLMGTAVSILPEIPGLRRRGLWLATAISLCLFLCTLVGIHLQSVRTLFGNNFVVIDYVTGATFALLAYVLLHHRAPSRGGYYSRVSRTLAGFSYTLYVTHIPLLVFLRAILVPDTPWLPTLPYFGAAVLLTVTCLLYAYLVGRNTEGKTDVVRRAALSLIDRSRNAMKTTTP